MRALCWEGVNDVRVQDVPDPRILNDGDLILKVRLSTACGSDLHLLTGHIPFMQAGDVIGHEFMGEVVEVGPGVTRHAVGDRVVVASFIGCGQCYYCRNDLWSLCDNTNTNPGITQALWGADPGGIFGYSHAMGGFKGSHAEYVRVPFADHNAIPIPDGVDDLSAVFASDSAPTGWMGADLGGVRPGDVVAVWGSGAVGQMAARSAQLLGAERVVVVDRFDYRLRQAESVFGLETLNYEHVDIGAALREMTGGRGPDVCIEAVGCEAHSYGPQYAYDQVKSKLKLETDRPIAVREAIHACRKGGTVFVLGVFSGVVDKFPLGAVMNKGLTLRGAQQHGQRYIPMLLDRMASGELTTTHLATHVLPLEEGARGYRLFKDKEDDCVRAVFRP
ncbi:threonine dehydrogenase-like Zn-dependent dehydrogenase [Saccharothrix saharensis]|uniref:Threonine dehydrogenase-like Zn-dependent dehydrogenase n=1 Tax=Saccharothrix saharensis TaxID=571190 RepID=A0A543J625_9PSEU|nr:zinc-dependent alcohol dehydrogenase [Saccharothrix saharensis]TQM78281.1 threonine dehydrogenase-like Zn-dependent dehydrogenase [Saccharothrix saharensis]